MPGTRRYVYLLPDGLPATVIDSQVVTVLARLAERGVIFDVFAWQFEPPPEQRSGLEARLARTRARLPGRVRLWRWPSPSWLVRPKRAVAAPEGPVAAPLGRKARLVARLRGTLLAVRDLVLAAWLVLCLLPSILRRQPIVVHARANALNVAVWLKRIHPGTLLVADVRGDAVAELQYLVTASAHSRAEAARLRARERRSLARADAVQCVSGPLRRRLVEEYGLRSDDVRVVPCLADERRFFFDSGARSSLRSEWGLSDEAVFVYSGSLLPWQDPDLVLLAFGRIARLYSGSRLLLLTPELELASRLLASAPFAERAIVRAATFDEVPRYLSAADAGLLLRRPHPLNEVASPTKFAEYLMTGLPLLLSKGIGDTDRIVEAGRFGAVLQSPAVEAEIDVKAAAVVDLVRGEDRTLRARRAAETLGLGAYLDEWERVYRTLSRAPSTAV